VQGVDAPYADAMHRSMKMARPIVQAAILWCYCDGWCWVRGDKLMFWLVIIFLIVLVIAPLRKTFFAAWRFTLPAIIGFVFAIVMIRCVMKINLPGLAVLGIGILVAIEAGVVGQQWFNETFGSKRR
jgi:hypothetical protein